MSHYIPSRKLRGFTFNSHEGTAVGGSNRGNKRTPGAGSCIHCKGKRCPKCLQTGQRMYDSEAEARHSWVVEAGARRGEYTYRCQVPIKCIANGRLICVRRIDFVLTYPEGRVELIEIKGYQEEHFKVRQAALEATWLSEHPEATYIEISVNGHRETKRISFGDTALDLAPTCNDDNQNNPVGKRIGSRR